MRGPPSGACSRKAIEIEADDLTKESDIIKVVKRTGPKTVKELLSVVCPLPEQERLHREFVREMLEVGLIEITTDGKVAITPDGDRETVMIPSSPAGELTNRQAQERFIRNLIRIAREWHSYKGQSEWEKMEGVLFSILVMIDGGSSTEPGFDITACHSAEDIVFLREHGDDWYPVDGPFNDGPMHEIFHGVIEAEDVR